MKLGAYTACLHDKPVAEALQTLAGLGLDSAEINSGGFLPPSTCRSTTSAARTPGTSTWGCSARPAWP